MQRRAIQLGLRGEVTAQYSQEWILGITDISGFVAQQREHVMSRNYDSLLTPSEDIYAVDHPETVKRLGL